MNLGSPRCAVYAGLTESAIESTAKVDCLREKSWQSERRVCECK